MIHFIDDTIVHRAAMLWVRVQEQGDGRIAVGSVGVTPFKATFWTVNCNFRHKESPVEVRGWKNCCYQAIGCKRQDLEIQALSRCCVLGVA